MGWTSARNCRRPSSRAAISGAGLGAALPDWSSASEAIRSDLPHLHRNGRLVAAFGDASGKRLEGGKGRELVHRALGRLAVHEMHEADAVGELEGGVAQASGLHACELFIHFR